MRNKNQFKLLNDFIHKHINPAITDFLVQNKTFHKFVHKTEFMKSKFWQSLDEAAFPEEYKNKLLDNNNSKKTKK